jgi:hypothetical protein
MAKEVLPMAVGPAMIIKFFCLLLKLCFGFILR